MSRATYGTIDVEIGGKKYTMKPTLSAYEKIETRMGGVRQAIENCSNMSIDGLTYIIASGCNIGQRDQKDLKEAIFEEGVVNVTAKVLEYLMALLNPSGKDSSDEEEEQPEGE